MQLFFSSLLRVLKFAVVFYVRTLVYALPTFVLVVLAIKVTAYLAEQGYMGLIGAETIVRVVTFSLLVVNVYVLIVRPRFPVLRNLSTLADKIPWPGKRSEPSL